MLSPYGAFKISGQMIYYDCREYLICLMTTCDLQAYCFYYQTQKTVYTWKASGMLIKVKDMWANLRTTILITVTVYGLVFSSLNRFFLSKQWHSINISGVYGFVS